MTTAKAKRHSERKLLPAIARSGFTPGQVAALSKLGLLEEQIAELRGSLMFLHVVITPASPVGPVRERLKDLEKALRKVESLLPARPTMLSAEAEGILLHAGGDPLIVKRAREAISALRASIPVGVGKLPQQRRYHAPWFAIGIIERALDVGFQKHYNPRYPDQSFQPKPIRALRPARDGAFAELVGVCWQAAGRTTDPDRAIREYLRIHGSHVDSLMATLDPRPEDFFGSSMPRVAGRRRKLPGLL